MHKYLKIILIFIFICIFLLIVNYLFFTDEGQIRAEIGENNITIEDSDYYLNVENYKNLKLPKKEFEKINLKDTEEYNIYFSYNKLLKKGNIDFIIKYGKNQ